MLAEFLRGTAFPPKDPVLPGIPRLPGDPGSAARDESRHTALNR